MQEVIKLKLSQKAIEQNYSKEIAGKFIESCLKLDASIFEPLIEEDEYFQDLDKYRFLDSMKKVFQPFKRKDKGDVTLKKGQCKGCFKGHQTHDFFFKNRFAFSYILYYKGNALYDIFICNSGTNNKLYEALQELLKEEGLE